MRLSEAAEKLKRQAAISVNAGKENEARELLFQKKKVMQAMERSNTRIQLLHQLSAKLNQVWNMKSTDKMNYFVHPIFLVNQHPWNYYKEIYFVLFV